MTSSQYDVGTSEFKVLFQNNELENVLSDDEESCAGNFTVDLPLIDLHPLLRLRSVQAQLGISSFTIDSLPITYTRRDFIRTLFEIPKKSVFCNLGINGNYMESLNLKPLLLKFDDYSAVDNTEAIKYINNMLHFHVNYFIIFRYFCAFIDRMIFKNDFLQNISLESPTILTKDELILLEHYVDIAMYGRYVFHHYVCDLTEERKIVVPDLAFTSKVALTSSFESNILSTSKNLKSEEERELLTAETTCDFSMFHDIKLHVDTLRSEKMLEARNAITTQLFEYFTNTDCLVYDEEGSLLPDERAYLVEKIRANVIMIDYGLKLRKLIVLESKRCDKRSKESTKKDFFSLSLDKDKSKCVFNISPNEFLVNDRSNITLSFSDNASYVLGGKVHPSESNVIVGPIFSSLDINNATPRLTSIIKGSNQRLFSAFRIMPKMIYLATNLVSVHCNNFWLSESDFRGFNLIHSQVIDDSTIQHRFICKADCDPKYYRLQRVNNILEQFQIVVLDQNFRMCNFQKRTYTRIALSLKPYDFDIN